MSCDKYVTDAKGLRATLDEFGVAIIPEVLDSAECQAIVDGFWDFFQTISTGWAKPLNRVDQTSWRGFFDLIPLHGMLFQHWGIGHSDFAWKLRQNRKLIAPFEELWGVRAEDLLVSFDGASFSAPSEITNRGWHRGVYGLHVDQPFDNSDFQCVQSWVTGLDVNEGDATLIVLEDSHKVHRKFAEECGKTDIKEWYKLTEEEQGWYEAQGCQKVRMVCPKGSMVFWDSRTIHCGAEPLKGRAAPNFRSVVYLCYTPRKLASAANLKKKQKAFNEGRMTTHWPHKVKLFPKTPRTYGKDLPEISEYKKPELSELGKKLAGF